MRRQFKSLNDQMNLYSVQQNKMQEQHMWKMRGRSHWGPDK